MMQHCIHIRLVLYPLLIHKQQQQQACSTCPGSHGRAAQATYLGQNCRVLPVTDAQRQEASLDDMESGSVKTFSLFASASRDAGLQARLDDLPALSVDPLKCLLLGPPRSGKTSIAFHYAHQLAAAGQTVLVFCRRAKMETQPFLLPEGVPASQLTYQRIQIKYIHSVQDLCGYACCMHLVQQPPTALVVDDLTDIMQPSRGTDRRQRDASLLKALTCLADGLAHWREAHGHSCDLLITDSSTADGSAPQQYIINRVCPLVLRLSGAPPGALSLSVDPLSAGLVASPEAADVALHLSLTHTHLRLEGISSRERLPGV